MMDNEAFHDAVRRKQRQYSKKDTEDNTPRVEKAPYKSIGIVSDYADYLQQTVGNQQIQRMAANGELHAMLKVSQLTDPLEREAEEIARVVASMPQDDQRVTDYINRVLASSSAMGGKTFADVSTDKPLPFAGLPGGRKLASQERSFFEKRMGADFSGVRVHTGPTADELAQAVNARAFTINNHIVFAKGEYAPNTMQGRHLMAHELAHVMQGESGVIQRRAVDSVDTFQQIKDEIFALDEADIDAFIKNKRSVSESTRNTFEKAISLFQGNVVRKAKDMIFTNLGIAKKEKKRYQDITEASRLYTRISQYTSAFDEADLLRARALIRAYKRADVDPQILMPKVRGSWTVEANLPGQNQDSAEKIAKELAQSPAHTVEKTIYETFFTSPYKYNPTSEESARRLEVQFKRDVERRYPELKEANEKDTETFEGLLSAKNKQDFPVLADVHIDYRILARKYQQENGGTLKGFQEEIVDNLDESIDAGQKTLKKLLKKPERVWELVPLVMLSMKEGRISKEDKIGKLIWHMVEKVQRKMQLRSILMAGIGIALGIAGFFTGGATWAAVALGAGGAVVSGIDLYFELESYNLHSDAAHATLGGEFSKDPGVAGIVFAIIGLVLDVADVAKALKAARAIKGASNLASEAGKQFESLVKGGKATSGISKSDFAALLKKFNESPEVLSRLGSSALKNKQLSAAYSKLFDLLDEEKALYVLEYFGREGAAVVDELPAALKAIESKGIKDVDEIGEILTDSRLRERYIQLSKGGTDWFENVALSAVRNPDSDKVVLGHFAREGTSYQKVAAHYKATYYKLEDWNRITKGLSENEIWEINKRFLKQQIKQEKKILFSHDPLKARPGSFFEREVDYLQDLGYKFRQKNQWTWEAFR